MKTEPDVFSINDLKKAENESTSWEGVRNYQARNFMRDKMKLGGKVFIYHSSCKNIGIAGIAIVSKESHPDLSALDPQSQYFDKKSTYENPRWFLIDVKWHKTFKKIITLQHLKQFTELQGMKLLSKGNRLSIMPITKEEFEFIVSLSK